MLGSTIPLSELRAIARLVRIVLTQHQAIAPADIRIDLARAGQRIERKLKRIASHSNSADRRIHAVKAYAQLQVELAGDVR